MYLTPEEEIDLTPYAIESEVSSTYETKTDKNSGKKEISVINKSTVLPLSLTFDAASDVIETWYTLTINDLQDETQISSFENQYKKLYRIFLQWTIYWEVGNAKKQDISRKC